MATNLTFPNEILEHIMDDLGLLQNTDALRECSVASYALCVFSQKHLFHSVDLTNPACGRGRNATMRISAALRRSPHLCQHVKKLYLAFPALEDESEVWSALLPILNSVDWLFLSGECHDTQSLMHWGRVGTHTLTALYCHIFPRLRTLDMNVCIDVPLYPMLLACPYLEDFKASWITPDNTEKISGSSPDFHTPISLHSLSFFGCTSAFPSLLRFMDETRAPIRTLSFKKTSYILSTLTVPLVSRLHNSLEDLELGDTVLGGLGECCLCLNPHSDSSMFSRKSCNPRAT